MRNRLVCLALSAVFLSLSGTARAQPSKKIPRIGFLIASSAGSQEPRIQAFKQGMRDLGYIEGQNVQIDLRSGEGKSELLPVAAAELAQLSVDIIVSGGNA